MNLFPLPLPLLPLLILLLTTAAALLLSSWSQDPTIDVPSRHVLGTASWFLTTGLLTQASCVILASSAAAARNLKGSGGGSNRGPGLVDAASVVVERYDTAATCAPYAFVAAVFGARLHAFSLGGYGPDDWRVVVDAPARGPELLRAGAARTGRVVRGVVGW
ncbi:hypothetical protein F4778DRAFT_260984 [Xylariomycetidae sp. FL2044]|nr:hypothetical protein F4778DRAFT_260984 [Xylariomycetidae sp. FL2044]